MSELSPLAQAVGDLEEDKAMVLVETAQDGISAAKKVLGVN